MFLSRRPDEPIDPELADWYRRLLAVVARDGVRQGEWRLLDATGWPDNQSCRNLVAWSWSGDGDTRHLVVINLSGQPAQGTIPLEWPGLAGRTWRLIDPFHETDFDRDGSELTDPGLFVDLKPWQSHLLALR